MKLIFRRCNWILFSMWIALLFYTYRWPVDIRKWHDSSSVCTLVLWSSTCALNLRHLHGPCCIGQIHCVWAICVVKLYNLIECWSICFTFFFLITRVTFNVSFLWWNILATATLSLLLLPLPSPCWIRNIFARASHSKLFGTSSFAAESCTSCVTISKTIVNTIFGSLKSALQSAGSMEH